MNKYSYTVVTSLYGTLNKSFDSNGNKTSNAILLHGNYNVEYIESIKQLFEKFKNLSPNQAIMQSVPKNGLMCGEIVADKFNDKTGYYLSKTQQDFEYSFNHILCFDHDASDEGFKIETPEQYVEVICDIDPKLKECQIGVTYGSSNCIYKDSVSLSDKKSFHMYILIENASNEKVKEYIDYLSNEACKKGYSHIKISKSGSLLERTCFDKAPTTPESLLFEAKPTLAPNITQQKPDDYFYNLQGGARDLNDIPFNDNKSKEIFQKMKEEVSFKAKTIREEFIKTEAQDLVTKRDITIEKAVEIIKNKVEDSILTPDTVLITKDKGEIAVLDILNEPTKYNKVSVLDPLGTNPNEFCAMIFNNEHNMIVHSFKHGGKNYYIQPDMDFIKMKCNNYLKADDTSNKEFVKEIKKYCTQLKLLNDDRRQIAEILLTKKAINSINDLNIDINFPDFEIRNKNKILKPTIDNLKVVLTSYKIQTSYDEILKEPIINIPNLKDNTDDSINTKFAYLKSEVTKYNLNKKVVDDYLPAIIDGNSINPLMDMVKSQNWDGIDRISELVSCIISPDEEFFVKNLITLWLIQCVAAWDSCDESPIQYVKDRFEQVLTFQGDQGVRKTQFFESLLPPDFSKYILTGQHLNTKNKDIVKQCISCGICELGELDATFKIAVEELKAFLSKPNDKFRLPYARSESSFKRKTSFCATVNPEEFLLDPTGNRRFLLITVTEILFDKYLQIDKQQLFAQAYEMYKQGHKWWIDQTQDKDIYEMLNNKHKKHIVTTAIDEIAQKVINATLNSNISNGYVASFSKKYVSATDIVSKYAPNLATKRGSISKLKQLLKKETRIEMKDNEFLVILPERL